MQYKGITIRQGQSNPAQILSQLTVVERSQYTPTSQSANASIGENGESHVGYHTTVFKLREKVTFVWRQLKSEQNQST